MLVLARNGTRQWFTHATVAAEMVRGVGVTWAQQGKTRVVGDTLRQTRIIRVAVGRLDGGVEPLTTRRGTGASRVLTTGLRRGVGAARRWKETGLFDTARMDALRRMSSLKFQSEW
jgi:hypothetical protein